MILIGNLNGNIVNMNINIEGESTMDINDIINVSKIEIREILVNEEDSTQRLINNIENYKLKREKIERDKLEKRRSEKENLIKTILSMKDRIEKLIIIGNCCVKNGIDIEGDRYSTSKHTGFYTDGWFHTIGFWKDSVLKYIGIEGGGCCHYNLRTDGKTVMVQGEEDIYILKRFIQEFDRFEKEFYDYVNLVCKSL